MTRRSIAPVSADQIEMQRRAAAALIERFANEERDADLISGLVEGQTDLFETMSAGLAQCDNDLAMADAIKKQIDALSARRDRLVARAERMKDALFDAVTLLGATVELPAATLVRTRLPEKVEVFDLDALPQGFFEEKTTRTARRDEIKKSLKAGQDVPGARMAPEGFTLAVRKK